MSFGERENDLVRDVLFVTMNLRKRPSVSH